MLPPILILCFLVSLFISPSHGQSCSNYTFPSNQTFSSCSDLPYLNSFLHYDYDQSAKTLKIAYRRTGDSSSKWVAWGINPSSQGMINTQALVAFQKSDGTIRAYTSPVTSYQTQLQEGNLTFPVYDLTATYTKNETIIFATLKLDNLSSTVNQVWQEGPLSSNSPSIHLTSGSNVQSMRTINILSGQSQPTSGSAVNSIKLKRNIHGFLNAISWGVMMPFGAVIARYLRVFPSADPAWFYLHVACQASAYITGVTGWALGLQLGNESRGVQYNAHRIIGIVLFCLGTLQVFALFLRPRKEHKYRFLWNIYHRSMGYGIIALAIINIYKGFDILDPDKKWKNIYLGIIIGIAFASVTLEVYTWCVVLKRKKTSNNSHRKMQNDNNGYYGYGAREHERVYDDRDMT